MFIIIPKIKVSVKKYFLGGGGINVLR
jgi:hypothetical protein